MFGKLPPQDIQAEEAFLGAVLSYPELSYKTIGVITPEMLYKSSNQLILAAMYDVIENGDTPDLITVTSALKKKGAIADAGGVHNITKIATGCISKNIEGYAKAVKEAYKLRVIIQSASEMVEDAYGNNDSAEVMDKAMSSIMQLYTDKNQGVQESKDVLDKLYSVVERKINGEIGKEGVKTGLHDIDRLLLGLNPPDLIILAGRPGMGKTSFILTLAKNMAVNNNIPVGIFSLEMSAEQLMVRMISSQIEQPYKNVIGGNLNDYQWKQMKDVRQRLEEAPLYIDDTPAISTTYLRAKAKEMKIRWDVKVIFFDYIQLAHGSTRGKGSREQEISEISGTCKAIAKELNIPVVALSQLSRAVESRGGDKRPQLSDLRESGALEQDADIVGFFYRPFYYGFKEIDGQPINDDYAELDVAKNRNGSIGTIPMKFIGRTTTFKDAISEEQIDYTQEELPY